MSKVRDIWRDLILTLREHHFSAPTREARLLLSEALSTSPSHIYLYWDHVLSREKVEKLYHMLEERLKGVPIQYVLGEWEFFSLNFSLKRGVFIPRLDTESWLEEAILVLKSRYENKPARICDLGCGCGVIGLTIIYWIPTIQLYAIDISQQALDLTRYNAGKLGVEDRVTVIQSDLFQWVEVDNEIHFDAILSNPPYVKEKEWSTLASEIRLHEPKEALVGGLDGLNLIRRILNDAPRHLRVGGHLYLEHDPSQVDEIKKLVSGSSNMKWDHVISDYQGIARATVLIRE